MMQSEMKFMLLTESSRSPPATHIGIHICNVNRLQEQAHTQRCISSKCHMPESCNVSEFTYRTTVFSKPKRTAKERGAREKVKEEESLKSRSDSTTAPPPRQWTHAPARVGQGAFLQPASDPSALAGRVCHCARVTPELQSTRGFPPRGRSTQTHHSSGSENSDLL